MSQCNCLGDWNRCDFCLLRTSLAASRERVRVLEGALVTIASSVEKMAQEGEFAYLYAIIARATLKGE